MAPCTSSQGSFYHFLITFVTQAAGIHLTTSKLECPILRYLFLDAHLILDAECPGDGLGISPDIRQDREPCQSLHQTDECFGG